MISSLRVRSNGLLQAYHALKNMLADSIKGLLHMHAFSSEWLHTHAPLGGSGNAKSSQLYTGTLRFRSRIECHPQGTLSFRGQAGQDGVHLQSAMGRQLADSDKRFGCL